jgi:hypothetical protein
MLSLAIPAIAIVPATSALAVATCPAGWAEDLNNAAIDGIFCDKLVTVDGSFVIPEGIDQLQVLAVAGGGGGGAGGKTTHLVAGGGGGAGELATELLTVAAGDTINYTVGSGGAGGAYTALGGATSGSNGEDSTVSIGSSAASVTAQGGRGGVNGEDGGTGGAAGGESGNDGGAGSAASALAGGGGGGWFSAGYAGTQGDIPKGGNGGDGHEYYSYPNLGEDNPHSAYPLNDTLMWNTNGNPEIYFLDRMGYGGPGGVVLNYDMSCTGDESQYFGYSIPEDFGTISELGQGGCAIYGVDDYSAANPVTAIHAGNGGSGVAGTSTDSYAQPTAGYNGFIFFRIFVPNEDVIDDGGNDDNDGGGSADSGSDDLASTGVNASVLASAGLFFASAGAAIVLRRRVRA